MMRLQGLHSCFKACRVAVRALQQQLAWLKSFWAVLEDVEMGWEKPCMAPNMAMRSSAPGGTHFSLGGSCLYCPAAVHALSLV